MYIDTPKFRVIKISKDGREKYYKILNLPETNIYEDALNDFFKDKERENFSIWNIRTDDIIDFYLKTKEGDE